MHSVNGVAPGIVGTDAYLAAPQAVRDALQPMIDATPVAPRVGSLDEVAGVVDMLCERRRLG